MYSIKDTFFQNDAQNLAEDVVVSDTPSQSQHATEDPDLEKEGSISDNTSISGFQREEDTMARQRYLDVLDEILKIRGLPIRQSNS